MAEIRTLNHRYLDISLRLPDELSIFEERIRTCLKKSLRRGKVNFTLHLQQDSIVTSKITVDIEAARRYHSILQHLKREFSLSEEPAISHFLNFPNVVKHEIKKAPPAMLWPLVNEAIELAMRRLLSSRRQEGKAMERALTIYVERIQRAIEHIAGRIPLIVDRYKERLSAKLKELAGNGVSVDTGRLETECALFAKNSDVSEELTRLSSHIKALRRCLKEEKETGRKLDFIAQEMAREINTVCQKGCDFAISQWGIKIKGEIDKIREQAQNIE